MDGRRAQDGVSGDQGREVRQRDRAGEALRTLLAGLDRVEGPAIDWRFANGLRVRRGRLEMGKGQGVEVHAASFARRREVLLDQALVRVPDELRRVVIHELFHFVWLRMNNGQRRQWGDLLKAERSTGELGWSSEWRRKQLASCDGEMNTRRWRDYVSESFSDTGAWLLSGGAGDQDRLLGRKWIDRRRRFMLELKSHWNGAWRI